MAEASGPDLTLRPRCKAPHPCICTDAAPTMQSRAVIPGSLGASEKTEMKRLTQAAVDGGPHGLEGAGPPLKVGAALGQSGGWHLHALDGALPPRRVVPPQPEQDASLSAHPHRGLRV